MTEYIFNAERITAECVQWIKSWFYKNGRDCNAYLGLSGGKDSTICAALLARALGKERVYGISMPNTMQDENDADKIAEFLGIHYQCVHIDKIYNEFTKLGISNYAQTNVPPRIRMTMLYALSQSNNGRTCETGNLSENMLHYFTTGGDNLSDFSPLGKLTVTEVKQMGYVLELPTRWIEKTPDDGLPNSEPDEKKLGIKYADLDQYIRTGELENKQELERIFEIHNRSLFKEGLINVPTYDPLICNYFIKTR